ncbi:hypothetical protein B0T14DRAFT_487154 [Immersiella caudata]|uniref:Uncharacterized protein n=1 Tax=Immersiella caudata TaxID=314043 RepID=A0AA39WG35_9PEZI|nr:hypothetical protein B0T14DRAFT_487154 [Immersiella caudata]
METIKSPFLELPREMRDQTNQEYLTLGTEGGYTYDFATNRLCMTDYTPIDLKLMYTCRLITTEMHGLALKSHAINFTTLYSEELRTRAGRWDYLMTLPRRLDSKYHRRPDGPQHGKRGHPTIRWDPIPFRVPAHQGRLGARPSKAAEETLRTYGITKALATWLVKAALAPNIPTRSPSWSMVAQTESLPPSYFRPGSGWMPRGSARQTSTLSTMTLWYRPSVP